MTEPTKEKVEKWKGEFEKSDYVRNYGYWRCLRKNFYGAYDDPDTERLWQGYLAAKNSDFEEIKTLKEQLESANAVIHHVVYSTEDSQGLAYGYLEENSLLKQPKE